MCFCHIATFINASHYVFLGETHMSEKEVQEWKTIRISAITYYKLLELSGILTALFGTKIAMSYLAEGIIVNWYNKIYPKASKILMNADKVKSARKDWKKYEGELAKLIGILTKSEKG